MPNTKLFLIVLYQIGIWEFKKEKKKKQAKKTGQRKVTKQLKYTLQLYRTSAAPAAAF